MQVGGPDDCRAKVKEMDNRSYWGGGMEKEKKESGKSKTFGNGCW